MSKVSRPLYQVPSHFQLGGLVNTNPDPLLATKISRDHGCTCIASALVFFFLTYYDQIHRQVRSVTYKSMRWACVERNVYHKLFSFEFPFSPRIAAVGWHQSEWRQPTGAGYDSAAIHDWRGPTARRHPGRQYTSAQVGEVQHSVVGTNRLRQDPSGSDTGQVLRGEQWVIYLAHWWNSYIKNTNPQVDVLTQVMYTLIEILFWYILKGLIDDRTLYSGNGFVPSGNRPFAEPMLTEILVAIWQHWAAMS